MKYTHYLFELPCIRECELGEKHNYAYDVYTSTSKKFVHQDNLFPITKEGLEKLMIKINEQKLYFDFVESEIKEMLSKME